MLDTSGMFSIKFPDPVIFSMICASLKNYLRVETIQGRKLFAEIRYLKIRYIDGILDNLEHMYRPNPISKSIYIKFLYILMQSWGRDLQETIEWGPLCIADLFQNKFVAYF